MYAVIETGGKQYRVEPGSVIEVERRPVAAKEREKVVFDRVLMVVDEGGTRVGNPMLEGAKVTGESLGDVRGPKVRIFKHRTRKHFQKNGGHRQDYLRVRIQDIAL